MSYSIELGNVMPMPAAKGTPRSIIAVYCEYQGRGNTPQDAFEDLLENAAAEFSAEDITLPLVTFFSAELLKTTVSQEYVFRT